MLITSKKVVMSSILLDGTDKSFNLGRNGNVKHRSLFCERIKTSSSSKSFKKSMDVKSLSLKSRTLHVCLNSVKWSMRTGFNLKKSNHL
jgi:hypothetical protein